MSTIILTGFYINQDNIAKNQCENRFVNLSCHGQCVLMKKIRQQEEQEQKNIESKIKEIHLFTDNGGILNFQVDHKVALIRNVNSNDFLEKKYTNIFISSIFHPPLV